MYFLQCSCNSGTMELYSSSVQLLSVKHHRLAGEICLLRGGLVLPSPLELLELLALLRRFFLRAVDWHFEWYEENFCFGRTNSQDGRTRVPRRGRDRRSRSGGGLLGRK